MVRLVTSQWLEPATFGSELAKVTSQDTLSLRVTLKEVLLVVSVAVDPVPVSVSEYSCPTIAEPEVVPQLSSVYSWADSVPFNGAPLADATFAVSLGSQSWVELLPVVSLTVKHSPELASFEPV